jgi:hypothetical protein
MHHSAAGVFSSDGEAGPEGEQAVACFCCAQIIKSHNIANPACSFLKGVISFGRKTENYPSGRFG